MKKLLTFILALSLVFALSSSLAGCNAEPGEKGEQGDKGDTPTIEISEDGYWVINGEKTNVKATPESGADENPQQLDFYPTDDGEYYVAVGNAKYLSHITIPEKFNGAPVVGITDSGFLNCNKLKSITIPDSVTSIGSSAFSGCTGLEEIYFNAIAMNDLSYSNYVFYNAGKNGNGIKVVVGKKVTKIPEYLFCPYYNSSSDSPKLISVEFEEGSVCASIGSYAFSNCTSFTSVTIGDSVTSIGSDAFYGCSSLTSVTIGDSVTSIGNSAFEYCYNLTSITVDKNNNYYKSIDGNLCTKDGKTLIQYAIGKTNTDFTIPNSVTYIGDYAFRYCTSLTSVTIPDSVTSIGLGAFSGCTSLTIYCEAESLPGGWNYNWYEGFVGTIFWGYKG